MLCAFPGPVRQICKGHIDGSACSLVLLGCVGLWMVDSRVENGDGVEMARSLYSTWHVSRCIGCHTETDGSLPGLGLLKQCNPARLTIASPDGLAWHFWTTPETVDSSPTKRRMDDCCSPFVAGSRGPGCKGARRRRRW